MSSKRGDSFEAVVALILKSGGFIIKEQPHQVIYEGQTMGDLDVIAEDPNTHSTVGVSCKEWFSDVPGTPEFSHFLNMLEFENLKYGIFASAQTIANTIPPYIQRAKSQKGINIITLDRDEIDKLKNWAYDGQDPLVEDYFRNRFGFLSGGQATIADIKRAQKSQFSGKTIDVDYLIPVNYNEPLPSYLENPDILIPESTLLLNPYLIIEYDFYLAATHPQTRETVQTKSDRGVSIVDATDGKYLSSNDIIYEHLEKIYHQAQSLGRVREDGFAVQKVESRIEPRNIISQLKSAIINKYSIDTTYTTASGERRPLIKRLSPDDIKIDFREVVYLPIWLIKYQAGSKIYKRSYFAYDGSTISDELEKCQLCKNPTRAVCTECFSTGCQKHRHPCVSCSKIVCQKCAKFCVDCNSSFCSVHKPMKKCGDCNLPLCDNCSINECKTCSMTLCKKDGNNCVECSTLVCSSHTHSKKYALITKNFCSNTCLSKFDSHYQSSGMFGKFKKVLGK
ncbi:MAG: restriction endonuclease [Nitrosotalea sp.]